MKTKRFCLFCHRVGILIEFDRGNDLKKHITVRHPRTKEQKSRDVHDLRQYRREVLLKLGMMGRKR